MQGEVVLAIDESSLAFRFGLNGLCSLDDETHRNTLNSQFLKILDRLLSISSGPAKDTEDQTV